MTKIISSWVSCDNTTPPATLDLSLDTYGNIEIKLKESIASLKKLGASKLAKLLVAILNDIEINPDIISRVTEEKSYG